MGELVNPEEELVEADLEDNISDLFFDQPTELISDSSSDRSLTDNRRLKDKQESEDEF